MTLEELDIDDEEELEETTLEPSQEEDDDLEKPWMSNQPEDTNQSEDDEDEEEESSNSEDDLLTALLKNKGVNPESVKILNANGEIEEKNFNDLTREEQLQILNYDDSSDNYGLDEDEVGVINFLRNNNMTIQQYNAYIGQQAVKDYLESNQTEVTHEIDSIPDDELFILDLKAKISDLTEDEAAAELDAAKANETLYAKRIQGLRAEYKAKEDAINAQEQQEAQEQASKLAAEYEQVIVNALKNNDSIDLGDSSITFSEDDMNEIASFILDSDAAGVRHIAKALNDPKTLIGMSWYALHGQEAFSQVADYYKKKITEASKYNYLKGYEDARNGHKPNSNKVTTVKRTSTKSQSRKEPKMMSINDLD